MRVILALSLLSVALGCVPTPTPNPNPAPNPSPGPTPNPDPSTKPKDENITLFGIAGGWPPYSYQDEGTGQGKGFLFDVVKAVCRQCGKKCDIVYSLSNEENCFNPEDLTGKGLNDRHFDACVGWTATIPRWNVFNFSSPMLDVKLAQMYVQKDSGVTTDNLKGKKIAFRKFWYMDKFCIRQSGVEIADDQVEEIVGRTGWEDLLPSLLEGKVEAIVVPNGHPLAQANNLVPIGPAVDCSYGGAAGLMHRKDVDTTWFEEGLRELKAGFGYEELCKKWSVNNCCK